MSQIQFLGSGSGSSSFSPNTTVQDFDDFLSRNSSPGFKLDWGNNTNRITNTTSVAGHDGIVTTDGSGADNNLYLSNGGAFNPFILGSGTYSCNWVIKPTSLSTGGNRYLIYVGIGDGTGGGEYSNGCYFVYSDNLNSGNWVLRTGAGGVYTSQNTSIAVAADWVNLGVQVNATATSVTYTINGTTVGTPITTNIPTAGTCPAFTVNSTAGAEPGILLDLMYYTRTFTTPR